MNKEERLEKLNSLFGTYKAEWLQDEIYNLFAEPSYFSDLKSSRPLVLQGGRGTGKTTVLKGLSYQGQYILHKENLESFDKNSFIGIYQKINTNQVRAFVDDEIPEKKWLKIFSHYFNLIICREMFQFLRWYGSKDLSAEQLSLKSCDNIRLSLNIDSKIPNQDILFEEIDKLLIKFQAKVNNLSIDGFDNLTLAGHPIEIVSQEIVNLHQFKNKMFFFLIDEYENLEDYQQKIINTLIKHTSAAFTFKIGVRERGWRIKHTLNSDEILQEPADYVRTIIDKPSKDDNIFFENFAKDVCQQRISLLMGYETSPENFKIENSLENITVEEEAILLQIEKSKHLAVYNNISPECQKIVEGLSPLYKFLISYWSNVHNEKLENSIKDYEKNKKGWNQRYENYKYELLFKIKKGRGKAGIQKYYSGWNTYIKLANGNIRYLMQLIYTAYFKHINDDQLLSTPVNVRHQTIAAQEVGEKNLIELEGLTKKGAEIITLLLGLGRIFNILSSSEGKTAPEQNQFDIEKSEDLNEDVKAIIDNSVMHLALVRSSGNKLSEDTDTRKQIYTVHPIFSAYFVFSYRKKRKIRLTQDSILELVKDSKASIKKIIRKYNLNKEESDLPQQMQIFGEFYDDKE
jgi:hypothetical protein